MCGIVPKRPEVKKFQVFETKINEGQRNLRSLRQLQNNN